MQQRKNNADKGGMIAVALIAFVIGRCSVDAPSAPSPKVQPAFAFPTTSASRPTEPDGAAIGQIPLIEPAPAVEPKTLIRPPTEFQPVSEPEVAVYYARCADARAAGAAPINEGEPGYAAHLDRDGDGVACE